MSYFLIESPDESEKQIVSSLIGYPGWTTLAETEHMASEDEVWDGTSFVVDWSRLDAELHAKIDREAGEFRKQFITDVPGQQAVYLAKSEEAKAWTVEADPEDFPYLYSEAQVRGITMADMAQMVLAIAAQWQQISVAIEVNRIQAKAEVSAATTRAAKQAAAQVDWLSCLP